ncbi:MAG: rod-binding protein [Sphingomonadaceae bacterium]|nr:rod-binding protein [Sphingomonadaceae bacterium]
MTPVSASLSAPAAVSASSQAPDGGREELAAAAKRFEAIFVRQMLAAARKTDFGETLFSSEATDTFRQMQDEKFAEIASQTGAFGFASIIEAQLARHMSKEE